jgi:uncharacterized DUF497 family protein
MAARKGNPNSDELEWDENKNSLNQKNHGYSFEEGATVFDDPLAYTDNDEEHSIDEQRLKSIGVSSAGKLLRVSFTERNNKFRIFSVRNPSRRERKSYEQD